MRVNLSVCSAFQFCNSFNLGVLKLLLVAFVLPITTAQDFSGCNLGLQTAAYNSLSVTTSSATQSSFQNSLVSLKCAQHFHAPLDSTVAGTV